MGSGPENFTCRLGALLAVIPDAGLAGRHRLSQRLDSDCGIRLRERDRDGREEDERGEEQGHEQQMLRDPGEWRQAEVGFTHWCPPIPNGPLGYGPDVFRSANYGGASV